MEHETVSLEMATGDFVRESQELTMFIMFSEIMRVDSTQTDHILQNNLSGLAMYCIWK